MIRAAGRLLRAPFHFAWNVLKLFYQKDLRKVLFRHNSHPVRLLMFRLLDTAWVLIRVLGVAVIGTPLALVFVAALAIGYGAAELLQVWSRIEPGEEVHVSSATWR